jgi:hypothetical protein
MSPPLQRVVAFGVAILLTALGWQQVMIHYVHMSPVKLAVFFPFLVLVGARDALAGFLSFIQWSLLAAGFSLGVPRGIQWQPLHVGPACSQFNAIGGWVYSLNRTLAVCLRSGRWIHLLPTAADSFDADYGGITLQFTRNAAAELTEVKVSGGRVRNLRHTRVALPKT